MKCWSTASLNGASLTTTPAGSPPGSSGKLPRPKRGEPPSAAVMFHTADKCPISSVATLRMIRRQRSTASASAADNPSAVPERRLKAAYRYVHMRLCSSSAASYSACSKRSRDMVRTSTSIDSVLGIRIDHCNRELRLTPGHRGPERCPLGHLDYRSIRPV